jgi:ferritin-like metal-binding protein YciE
MKTKSKASGRKEFIHDSKKIRREVALYIAVSMEPLLALCKPLRWRRNFTQFYQTVAKVSGAHFSHFLRRAALSFFTDNPEESGVARNLPKEKTMAKVSSLEALYINELRVLYHAETQWAKILCKLAKAAKRKNLQGAFKGYVAQAETHAAKVRHLLQILNKGTGRGECIAMKSLINNAKELLEEKAPPEIRNVALIGAAQKIEHYEIAGYAAAKAHAGRLGRDQDMRVLESILQQERAADKTLTALAETFNAEALQIS